MLVEKFKIKGWKKKETGIVISENDDWILTKHIPVDYVIDGFKLYNKKFIKKRTSLVDDKLITVLNLKKLNLSVPKSFNFGTALEILNWSEKKYGLFEFQDNKENELFYGKLNEAEENYFIIDMIKSDGKIELKYNYDFSLEKIRVITFETDYFNSIILLMNHELSKN
ncbi:MAG: hypothetical protein ABIQ27_04745 [Flavobacterium sp.]|uniref:hypothetical protein n=1 Tax=Flavobacterium sp. TaxID=239 RepID=UPI003266818A